MATKYNLLDANGVILKTISGDKGRAIADYEADTSQTIAAVYTAAGTFVHGDPAVTPTSDDKPAKKTAAKKTAVKKTPKEPKAKKEPKAPPTDAEKQQRREERNLAVKELRARLAARPASEIEYPDTKKCSRCKKTKNRDEYNTDHTNTDGLRYWCKSCFSDYARERAAARKAK